MNNSRPSSHAYMMNLARMAASRATCPRRSVGAILAKDGRVVSTGYNGAPPGMQHCFGDGCKNASGNCVNTIHAEANALLHATMQGDTLYCTDMPCASCLKAALAHNADINVLYWRHYPDADRDQFIELHGIATRVVQADEELNAEMLRFLPSMPGERLP